MHGLTYGVIRVDSEEKLSVLTVQDVGLVMPGGECIGFGVRSPRIGQGFIINDKMIFQHVSLSVCPCVTVHLWSEFSHPALN